MESLFSDPVREQLGISASGDWRILCRVKKHESVTCTRVSLACPFSSKVSFVNTEWMNRCFEINDSCAYPFKIVAVLTSRDLASMSVVTNSCQVLPRALEIQAGALLWKHITLLRRYRSLLWRNMTLLQRYADCREESRSSSKAEALWRYRALLWRRKLKTLLRRCRALLRSHGALLRRCRAQNNTTNTGTVKETNERAHEDVCRFIWRSESTGFLSQITIAIRPRAYYNFCGYTFPTRSDLICNRANRAPVTTLDYVRLS